jgi:hypothetical protein
MTGRRDFSLARAERQPVDQHSAPATWRYSGRPASVRPVRSSGLVAARPGEEPLVELVLDEVAEATQVRDDLRQRSVPADPARSRTPPASPRSRRGTTARRWPVTQTIIRHASPAAVVQPQLTAWQSRSSPCSA